jgi:hypothetical protein
MTGGIQKIERSVAKKVHSSESAQRQRFFIIKADFTNGSTAAESQYRLDFSSDLRTRSPFLEQGHLLFLDSLAKRCL